MRLEGPIEKDFILFFNFVRRVRQTMGKCTIVGEEDQAFALLVEPPNVKKPPEMSWDEVQDGRPSTFVGSRADNPFRFVQEDVSRRGGSQRRFPHPDVVARINDRGQVANEMAVDEILPSRMRASQARRDPKPEAARNRFKRMGAPRTNGRGNRTAVSALVFRFRLRQPNHALALCELAALFHKLDALEPL